MQAANPPLNPINGRDCFKTRVSGTKTGDCIFFLSGTRVQITEPSSLDRKLGAKNTPKAHSKKITTPSHFSMVVTLSIHISDQFVFVMGSHSHCLNSSAETLNLFEVSARISDLASQKCKRKNHLQEKTCLC